MSSLWDRWRPGADEAVRDPENLLELAALERLVRRSGGFRFAVAVVNHAGLRDRLMKAAQEDLRDLTITAVEVGEESLVEALEKAAAESPAAIFVTGLERAAPLAEDPAVAWELNLNRDYLWRTVPVPVVVWAPDFAVQAFARRAVDLWSGRSGVFRFRPEEGDDVSTADAAADGLDWSTTPEERGEREALLGDLLAELDQHAGASPARAAVLVALGHAARMQDRYREAADLYGQALPIHREVGDRLGEANALRSLGDAALAQGRYREAADLYGQALPIHREIGDRRGEANALLGLGRALAATGSPSAEAILEDAAALYDTLGRADLAEAARAAAAN